MNCAKVINDFGSFAKIVSKIEKPEAVVDIDNIIDATDAIMVARGDLGVEIPYSSVPMVQKDDRGEMPLKGKAVYYRHADDGEHDRQPKPYSR